MRTAIVAAALLASVASPALAADWWTTASMLGAPFQSCDHETKDDGVDPGELMARIGPAFMQNTIGAFSWQFSTDLGSVSIAKIRFNEGSVIVFAYASTAAACEAIRSGKLPITDDTNE